MALKFKPGEPPEPRDPYGHIPHPSGGSNLPLLVDCAEFIERSAVRSVLMEAKTRRQAQLDLVTTLAWLRSDSHIGEQRDRQNARVDQLRRIAEMPASIPEPPADGLPPALSDALNLLAGQQIEPPPDVPEQKRRLRQEIGIIDAGLAVAEQRLDETREAQTTAVAETLRPFHNDQLRRIYEAAALLAEAVSAERQTISDFITAGYGDASAILLRPSLAAAGRLGSLEMPESEISLFRKRMQEIGVL
jgi:hypothetical protein